MATPEDLLHVWEGSRFTPPNIALARVSSSSSSSPFSGKGEIYVVVSDEGEVFSLLDDKGDVFYVGRARCKVGSGLYLCQGPLFSMGCLIDKDRVEFARKEILPLYYTRSMVW